jgi:hypothetical protein
MRPPCAPSSITSRVLLRSIHSSSADMLESLLRHELRYCAQAAATGGLDLDPECNGVRSPRHA